MKKILLLIALVLCVNQCSGQKGFPKQFQATINMSDSDSSPDTVINVLYKYENLKVRLEFPTENDTYMMIYNPKGAEPDSLTNQAYTMFSFNLAFPKNNTCGYATDLSMIPVFQLFPRFFSYNGSVGKITSGLWFPLPTNMINKGQEWIPELKINATRYDSQEICDLQLDNLGKVPCISYFETDERPVKTLQAVIYDTPVINKYISNIYMSFTDSISSEAEHLLDLPDQWPSVCRNLDAGFILEPGYRCVITPNTPANLTIKLKTPLVRALGDQVKINITKSTSLYLKSSAAECAKFSPVVYDADTWNKPQVVTISYLNDGDCWYDVSGTGGGYEGGYLTESFDVHACHEEDDDVCKGAGVCSPIA